MSVGLEIHQGGLQAAALVGALAQDVDDDTGSRSHDKGNNEKDPAKPCRKLLPNRNGARGWE
jgi:hypothetical protein